ncbi:MAG TPA: ACP S-malonyltransferase, partial [Elusimicrobiota bacterium]|nr:ACP S-malonyltransferase [Elusimicrobiota bacterium]
KGIVPQWTAGHSLGEYSALHAAGAFDLDTGLLLVKARGEAIQEASEKIPGTMAALIGLERAQVVDLCKTASAKGVCEPVNYNCPGQIVIAGAVDAVKEAIALAQQAGATKSILLNVSGPFHSSLMKPAADKMRPVLESAAIVDAAVPVTTNVDGQPTRSASEIRQKLALQIDHAVLWEDGIRQLAGQSPDLFLEAGPGRVLSGLLRRIDKTKKAANVEDRKSVESLLQQCGLTAQ